MIEVFWDSSFNRIYKKWQKRHPDLIGKFEERLRLFCGDPQHPTLKTHALTGELKGLYAFSINYSHRLVFEYVGNDRILLVDIGKHDDVY